MQGIQGKAGARPRGGGGKPGRRAGREKGEEGSGVGGQHGLAFQEKKNYFDFFMKSSNWAIPKQQKLTQIFKKSTDVEQITNISKALCS